jgi:hypothetical protein
VLRNGCSPYLLQDQRAKARGGLRTSSESDSWLVMIIMVSAVRFRTPVTTLGVCEDETAWSRSLHHDLSKDGM